MGVVEYGSMIMCSVKWRVRMEVDDHPVQSGVVDVTCHNYRDMLITHHLILLTTSLEWRILYVSVYCSVRHKVRS